MIFKLFNFFLAWHELLDVELLLKDFFIRFIILNLLQQLLALPVNSEIEKDTADRFCPLSASY